MQQIEDFFAQLDEADVQSAVDTPQSLPDTEVAQNTDEHVTTDTDAFAENTGFSAEELMDVYVEAYRNLDFGAILLHVTGTARDIVEAYMRIPSGEIQEEILNTALNYIPEGMPEDIENGTIQLLEEIVHGPMMQEYIQSMFRQVEGMSSEY